ncbi:unnamed protein product, partial [Ixodes hexagonus]
MVALRRLTTRPNGSEQRPPSRPAGRPAQKRRSNLDPRGDGRTRRGAHFRGQAVTGRPTSGLASAPLGWTRGSRPRVVGGP